MFQKLNKLFAALNFISFKCDKLYNFHHFLEIENH